MFDPVSSQQLKSITISCTKCAEKIMKMQSHSIDQSCFCDETSINDEACIQTAEEDVIESSMEIDQRISTCLTEPPIHED